MKSNVLKMKVELNIRSTSLTYSHLVSGLSQCLNLTISPYDAIQIFSSIMISPLPVYENTYSDNGSHGYENHHKLLWRCQGQMASSIFSAVLTVHAVATLLFAKVKE